MSVLSSRHYFPRAEISGSVRAQACPDPVRLWHRAGRSCYKIPRYPTRISVFDANSGGMFGHLGVSQAGMEANGNMSIFFESSIHFTIFILSSGFSQRYDTYDTSTID